MRHMPVSLEIRAGARLGPGGMGHQYLASLALIVPLCAAFAAAAPRVAKKALVVLPVALLALTFEQTRQ